MNRKTLYWTGGIAAVIIILLIIWAAFGRNTTVGSHTDHTGTSGSTSAGSNHTTGENTAKNTGENSDLTAYLKDQDALMDKMMEDMESVEPTGSAALDFLVGMIPHHEAAVTMSESYLKYGGSDNELRQLAENIIDVQKEEIQQMQAMADEIRESGTQDEDQENAYLKAYNQMLSGHHNDHSSHAAPNNVEAAFAEGMIMHHQMAVDMAQAILDHTDEKQVLTLAQNIVDAQKSEISQMQAILKRVADSDDAAH